MIEIIPTVVPLSLADIAAAADSVRGFARTLHVDVADGVFAPNTTWMPQAGEKFPMQEGFTYEAHLMVANPREVGEQFVRAGASRIIGHLEAMQGGVEDVIAAWKKSGAAECGLGMLYQTPIESLDAYASLCDVVQMMSIRSIGVQGIPYAEEAPERIAALHARHPDLLIADDGGVSEKNISALAHAGVRRFCVGSALSKSNNQAQTAARLMQLATEAASV